MKNNERLIAISCRNNKFVNNKHFCFMTNHQNALSLKTGDAKLEDSLTKLPTTRIKSQNNRT